jgi:hypothetical protein
MIINKYAKTRIREKKRNLKNTPNNIDFRKKWKTEERK